MEGGAFAGFLVGEFPAPEPQTIEGTVTQTDDGPTEGRERMARNG